jgi:hypothetical protein
MAQLPAAIARTFKRLVEGEVDEVAAAVAAVRG